MSDPEPLPNSGRESRSAARPIETLRDATQRVSSEIEKGSVTWIDEDLDRVDSLGSDIEQPSRDNQLAAHEAMLLNNLLVQQAAAAHLTAPAPADHHHSFPSRPLYDWFVSALNLTPICNALLGFVERLAAWKQSAQRIAPSSQEEQAPDDSLLVDWKDPRGLRV